MSNFGSFLFGTVVGAIGVSVYNAYQEEHRQEILDRFKRGPEVHHANDADEKKHEKSNSESINDIEKTFASTSEVINRVMKDVLDALNVGDLEKAKKNLERCKGTMHSIFEDFSGTINGQIKRQQQAHTNCNQTADGQCKCKISEDPNASIGI